MKIRNKYHAIPQTINGIRFDSTKEANRWCELKLLERSGLIQSLQRQVKYILIDKSKYGREISYKADFVYYDVELNQTVVEDVKSKATVTSLYKLKKRLLAERYGIIIKEYYG